MALRKVYFDIYTYTWATLLVSKGGINVQTVNKSSLT
jgi:hypothetical protein